jgi:DNA adenine methylase
MRGSATSFPSFLRWAGSKKQLIPVLAARAPTQFTRYIEPFVGSAALFFHLRPELAVLSDINSELIHAFTAVRVAPGEIAEKLSRLPTGADHYYRLRATNPASLEPIERAVRFIFLNRFCFNGVYRTNQKGMFNVPFGCRTGRLPTREHLENCAKVLEKAEFRCVDFEESVGLARTGDFVYADPPYATGSRYRGEYGYGGFQEKDLARFAAVMQAASARGAQILISYSETPVLRESLAGWCHYSLEVRRHVAGSARHRSTVREQLLANF